MTGITFGGLAAGTGRNMTGIILGSFNYIRGGQTGLAVGIINYSRNLNGVQLGLVNYVCDNPKYMRPLPFINVHFK